MSWPCPCSSSSNGTEKSGVPMKIRRRGMSLRRASAGRFSELRRLGVFLDDAVALQLGDVVDEQHAVEMVDLVLDAGRQQTRCLDLMLFAVKIEIAEHDLRRPLDLLVVC